MKYYTQCNHEKCNVAQTMMQYSFLALFFS
jgi:hypothetical protein